MTLLIGNSSVHLFPTQWSCDFWRHNFNTEPKLHRTHTLQSVSLLTSYRKLLRCWNYRPAPSCPDLKQPLLSQCFTARKPIFLSVLSQPIYQGSSPNTDHSMSYRKCRVEDYRSIRSMMTLFLCNH